MSKYHQILMHGMCMLTPFQPCLTFQGFFMSLLSCKHGRLSVRALCTILATTFPSPSSKEFTGMPAYWPRNAAWLGFVRPHHVHVSFVARLWCFGSVRSLAFWNL